MDLVHVVSYCPHVGFAPVRAVATGKARICVALFLGLDLLSYSPRHGLVATFLARAPHLGSTTGAEMKHA